MDRSYTIALFLLGGAAGAPFLPKLVATARGDLTLAVALMALLTVGTILFMPFVLPFLIRGMRTNVWTIERPLLLLILLPLVVGMLIKARTSMLAAYLALPFIRLASASLLLLFVLLLARNFTALLGVIGSGAILAAFIYVAALFACGWIAGGLHPGAREVLSLTTAARNFGAALVPATTSFADNKVTIALIVNAIVGLVFSFGVAAWLRRRATT